MQYLEPCCQRNGELKPTGLISSDGARRTQNPYASVIRCLLVNLFPVSFLFCFLTVRYVQERTDGLLRTAALQETKPCRSNCF